MAQINITNQDLSLDNIDPEISFDDLKKPGNKDKFNSKNYRQINLEQNNMHSLDNHGNHYPAKKVNRTGSRVSQPRKSISIDCFKVNVNDSFQNNRNESIKNRTRPSSFVRPSFQYSHKNEYSNSKISKQIVRLLRLMRNDNLDNDQIRILAQKLNCRPLNLQVTREHNKMVYNFEQDDILRIIDIKQTIDLLLSQDQSTNLMTQEIINQLDSQPNHQYNSNSKVESYGSIVRQPNINRNESFNNVTKKISTINDEVIKYIRFFNDATRIAYLGRKSKIRIYEMDSLYQYPKPWIIQFKDYEIEWFDITQDGIYLAISVQNNEILIYRFQLSPKNCKVEILEQVYSYVHGNKIQEIKFTYDQKYLVSCSYDIDTDIVLYNLKEKKKIELIEKNNKVFDFDLSSNSQKLATVGTDHTVRIYDLEDIENSGNKCNDIAHYKEQRFDASLQISCLSLSSDGQAVAIGGNDNTIVIIKSWGQNDDYYQKFYVKSKYIQRIFFVMDDQYLIYISKENSIYFLNVKQFNRQWIEICQKKIYGISISNDMSYMASLCDNNVIKVMDYEKMKEKWREDNYIQDHEVNNTLYDEIFDYQEYNYEVVKGLAFTPDSRYLVFVGKSLLEHYDINNKQIITMKDSQKYEKYLDDYHYEVKFSQSKYMFLYGEKQKIYVFVQNQQSKMYTKCDRVIEISCNINDIEISYDEKILGVVGDFKYVKLFDLSHDNIRSENLYIKDNMDIDQFTKIAFSSNNANRIGLVGNDKKIYVFNRTYLTWCEFEDQHKYINQIMFQNVEKNLVSISNDGTMTIYNIQNKERHRIVTSENMKIKKMLLLNNDQQIIYSGNCNCIYTINSIFENQQKFLKVITYFRQNLNKDVQDINIAQFKETFNIQVTQNVNFIYFMFLYFANNRMFVNKDLQEQELIPTITKIFEALIHYKIQIHFSQDFYTEEFDSISFLNIYEFQDLKVKVIFMKYIISIPKYQCVECRQNIYDILMISLKKRINIPSEYLDYFLVNLDFQINLQSDEDLYYFRSTRKTFKQKFFEKVQKKVMNQKENQKNLTFEMYDVEIKNQLDFKDMNDFIENDIIQVINRNYSPSDDIYQSKLLKYLTKYQWKRYAKKQYAKEGILQVIYVMSYMIVVTQYSIKQIKMPKMTGIEFKPSFLVVCYIFTFYYNISKLYQEIKELYTLRKYQTYNQGQNQKYIESQEQMIKLSQNIQGIETIQSKAKNKQQKRRESTKKKISLAFNKYLVENIGGKLVKELKYKSFNIYFKSYWNNFEITCFALIFISNIIELSGSHFVPKEVENKLITNIYKVLILTTVFLVSINMLKYFRVSEKFSGLFRLLGNVINDMKYFLTIFALFVVNFIWVFYIYQVDGFRELENIKPTEQYTYVTYSWFSIIRYVTLLSLGDFSDFIKADSHGSLDADKDYLPDDMGENSKSYLLYFFFFLAALFLQVVMLNLLISIIGESYSEFKATENQSILYERVMMISEINRNNFESQKKKLFKKQQRAKNQEHLDQVLISNLPKPFTQSNIFQNQNDDEIIRSKLIVIHKLGNLDKNNQTNEQIIEKMSHFQQDMSSLADQVQEIKCQQKEQLQILQQIVKRRNLEQKLFYQLLKQYV